MLPIHLFFIVICFVCSFSLPYPNQFTTDLGVVKTDGELEVYTWNYDAEQNAERLVLHGEGGKDTIELRLYSQRKVYFVVDDQCAARDLSEDTMPLPTTRIFSHMAKASTYIGRQGFFPGPVHPSLFDIPSACLQPRLRGDELCNSCIVVMDQVVSLGCNATAAEISKLCGTLFDPVCKQCLKDLCSGTCQIEECASDACCGVDFCTGTSCTSAKKELQHSKLVPKATNTDH